MDGEKKDCRDDEQRFNETLKRMLSTPPKPHVKAEDKRRAVPNQKSGKKDTAQRKAVDKKP